MHPYPGSYVGKELVKCASLTKQYSRLIIFIAKTNFYDIDRAEMVGIYKNNKELFEFLCKELSTIREINVSITLGYLLGVWDKMIPSDYTK